MTGGKLRTATAALCSAHPDVRAMSGEIRALLPDTLASGRARTVRIEPGENAAVHRAVHRAEAGDVLVVDARSDRSFGSFGDLLATCCRDRGVVGLVIDGSVRDVSVIRSMGFPVFCLGSCPAATKKTEPGDVDIEIRCGGVIVRPGDLIVADEDGVVVIPAGMVDEVGRRVGDVLDREEHIRAKLADGLTTYEILGLSDPEDDGPGRRDEAGREQE